LNTGLGALALSALGAGISPVWHTLAVTSAQLLAPKCTKRTSAQGHYVPIRVKGQYRYFVWRTNSGPERMAAITHWI